ncbi:MAG: HEAT repeat domain-containing protein [Gemmatimonadales bacterium]
MRAFQMYLPNNPIYQRSIDSLRSAFNPIWAGVPELVLTIAETDLVWQDQVVYHQESRSESFAWMLYKDGMRQLTLRPDCERDEVVLLLQTVVRARLLAVDAGDDLLTLLWEHDFVHIDYRFAEIITDTLMVLDPHAAEMSGADPFRQVETQQKIRQELGSFAPGMVDDFDSTLYFLDEAEIRALKEQVEKEYQSDVRTSALAAMLDIFELQSSAEVRGEVIEILESVFPNLLNRGEFRIVAWLLRELRLVASRAGMVDDTVRRRLDSFETRLSESGILSQMLQVVDQAAGIVEDDDLTELLKELRAPALEPLLAHLGQVKNASAKEVLQNAADRIARGHVDALIGILRNRSSPGLIGAVELCQRVNLPPALAPLGDLVGHPEPEVRRAAVTTLGAVGTPGAISLLERGLDDPDRGVRLAAVSVIGERGYKGALKRLEAVVSGKGPHELERAEKRQFFEAFASVAGPNGLEALADILEPKGLFRRKESPETRTCAAYAVARIRTAKAKELLERASQDKELSVRNAASRALREWDE